MENSNDCIDLCIENFASAYPTIEKPFAKAVMRGVIQSLEFYLTDNQEKCFETFMIISNLSVAFDNINKERLRRYLGNKDYRTEATEDCLKSALRSINSLDIYDKYMNWGIQSLMS